MMYEYNQTFMPKSLECLFQWSPNYWKIEYKKMKNYMDSIEVNFAKNIQTIYLKI